MEYKNLLIEKDGAVELIFLNRPKSMNSLNLEILDELHCAIYEAGRDESVRVVLLTGAGDKAFVSGADISAMKGINSMQARQFSEKGHNLLLMIETLPKPVIAALNGYALGGGFELAMACDMIYAADNAKMGQPEINLGIIPGFGGCIRLQKLVGKWRAKELIFGGDIIDAAKAKDLGIVLEVFPREKFLEEVRAIAKKIVGKAPLALQQAKVAINGTAACSMEAAVDIEKHAFAVLFGSEDALEGVSAFLEKRPANFKGK